jgi:hypothetical protein
MAAVTWCTHTEADTVFLLGVCCAGSMSFQCELHQSTVPAVFTGGCMQQVDPGTTSKATEPHPWFASALQTPYSGGGAALGAQGGGGRGYMGGHPGTGGYMQQRFGQVRGVPVQCACVEPYCMEVRCLHVLTKAACRTARLSVFHVLAEFYGLLSAASTAMSVC